MRLKLYMRLMFVIAAFAILMLVIQDAHGEEAKSYLKPSYLDSSKTNVYATNDKGADKQDGFLRKSYLDPRKTVLYDKDGKAKGYFRKSYLDPRKTVYYPVED